MHFVTNNTMMWLFTGMSLRNSSLAFEWHQKQWPWMTLNAKIKIFYGLFCNLWLSHIFQERILLKLLEIDWDSRRIKLSALNVVFTSLNIVPCVQEILRTWESDLGIPLRIFAFGHSNGSSHARRWRHLAYMSASSQYQLLESVSL